MHIETVTHKGKTFAMLPMKDLRKLIADSEELSDIAAYDAAKKRLARGEDEIIPFSLVEARINGEPPVKIWREYRKMTQEKLATTSGISRVMIAAIEAGTKKGTVTTLKKLAAALNVSLDQLAGT